MRKLFFVIGGLLIATFNVSAALAADCPDGIRPFRVAMFDQRSLDTLVFDIAEQQGIAAKNCITLVPVFAAKTEDLILRFRGGDADAMVSTWGGYLMSLRNQKAPGGLEPYLVSVVNPFSLTSLVGKNILSVSKIKGPDACVAIPRCQAGQDETPVTVTAMAQLELSKLNPGIRQFCGKPEDDSASAAEKAETTYFCGHGISPERMKAVLVGTAKAGWINWPLGESVSLTDSSVKVLVSVAEVGTRYPENGLVVDKQKYINNKAYAALVDDVNAALAETIALLRDQNQVSSNTEILRSFASRTDSRVFATVFKTGNEDFIKSVVLGLEDMLAPSVCIDPDGLATFAQLMGTTTEELDGFYDPEALCEK